MPEHDTAAGAPATARQRPDGVTGEAIGAASDADQPDAGDQANGGYSTAELLGNAALAVGALVAIWAALQGLGEDIIDWIGSQLMSG